MATETKMEKIKKMNLTIKIGVILRPTVVSQSAPVSIENFPKRYIFNNELKVRQRKTPDSEKKT